MVQPDPPRVLDLGGFSFNFTVTLEQRVAGRMGAPAWSLRKRRLDESLAKFWQELDADARRLDALAGSGLIDAEGRPEDHGLLDADGEDAITARENRRRHLGEDGAALHRAAWNRAWSRHLRKLDLGPLQEQVEAYNRWFPTEANLALDPCSGRILFMGEPWQPADAPDEPAILARHPLR